MPAHYSCESCGVAVASEKAHKPHRVHTSKYMKLVKNTEGVVESANKAQFLSPLTWTTEWLSEHPSSSSKFHPSYSHLDSHPKRFLLHITFHLTDHPYYILYIPTSYILLIFYNYHLFITTLKKTNSSHLYLFSTARCREDGEDEGWSEGRRSRKSGWARGGAIEGVVRVAQGAEERRKWPTAEAGRASGSGARAERQRRPTDTDASGDAILLVYLSLSTLLLTSPSLSFSHRWSAATTTQSLRGVDSDGARPTCDDGGGRGIDPDGGTNLVWVLAVAG